MKRLAASVLVHWLVSLSCFAAGELSAAEVQLNGHTFTLPDGFEIEQIAGPPLVNRPIVADFDEQGRLYVADSAGTNAPVEKQLMEKPHRIVRLADTDGDGRFDQSTVFADHMMFPEGAMWLDGSLYVGAPPSIWKLTDTDDDGVADNRTEWFAGQTLTGCANDLHGPYLGPDGWIYWCKGAFAKQTYERPGKPPLVTRAAHIFRARPDGSGIEPVMTGGMDNPVDVVFTPGGERIFTTTFLQHPGGGFRDGLIHAIYGGVYGKVHEVLDGHPRTSPDVMPVLVHLGPAAPCGLTRYESTALGEEYHDNLFACLFNMNKVTRHVLSPNGATFKTRDEDFLVAGDKDFHPTDVVEDADGSLIVIDTGGWYKLCCPTSQLSKPDLLGAIYRIRRKDAKPIDDPRGLKLAWAKLSAEDLAKLLGDPRPAVCKRAIQALAKLGPPSKELIDKLAFSKSVTARCNAVWAMTRIDDPPARWLVRLKLLDDNETVRQAAIHSVSIWRDHEAVPRLIDILKEESPQNRRAAAEALGRIGDKSAVPALLDALVQTPLPRRERPGEGESVISNSINHSNDPILAHSLTFALIEIADPAGTSAGLASRDAQVHKATLMALDQMSGDKLDAYTVIDDLSSADPELRETAAWIIARHPDWASKLGGLLMTRLMDEKLSASDLDELVGQLARFSEAPPVERLLAGQLLKQSAPRRQRQCVLRAMAQSGRKQVPAIWIRALAQVLSEADPELAAQAVSTVRALPLAKNSDEPLRAGLLKVAQNGDAAVSVRLEAIAALPGGLSEVPPPLFTLLTAQLGPDQPVSVRGLAVEALSHARLDSAQLMSLAAAVKIAGPLEIDRLLAAFEQSTDEQVGLALVAALGQSAGKAALRVETLRPQLARFGDQVAKQSVEFLAALEQDTGKQRARLDELVASLAEGDIRRGQAVFNGTKAACSSCHAIGYLGGNIGPDLTRIGQIRTKRDLVESIVFPSASFVRSYEPITVATTDGKVFSGVLRKDADDEIILATSAKEVARIPREEIEEIRPGTVSIMPAGLEQQLTLDELADLVTFLKACQ